jgi:lambda family phage portal protein
VPASEILHVCRVERPGQVRAVSWMSSAMQTLNHLDAYQKAELIAARVASCKMGFYKTVPGETTPTDGTMGTLPVTDAEPGIFETMPTGWDFQTFDPQHPAGNYPVFVKATLRSAAGGLGVAYNNFANDLDGVSYSSIRSGVLEERENWMVVQDWFINCFARPVYAEWLSVTLLTGAVKLPAAKREKYLADTWLARRWPWVDPSNDIDAKIKEVSLGITSKSAIAAEAGRDRADVIADQARDNEIDERNGLAATAGTTTETGVAVQDTALNGAQVQSATQIVKDVVAGDLPRATGVAMLEQFFQLTHEAAEQIMGQAGAGFKPKNAGKSVDTAAP